MHSLIVTAKLSEVDPRAWLADAIALVSDRPVQRLHELPRRNWRERITEAAA
jgi:hypothetical protein